MTIAIENVPLKKLSKNLSQWVNHEGRRLGTITSIDGNQVVTLVLDPASANKQLWVTPLAEHSYPSLTPAIAPAHWFERAVHDMFGITPSGHPRLKPAILNESNYNHFAALLPIASGEESYTELDTSYLHVKGEGIYEIAVGPVHAGIIEPGHFRFNCLGEVIVNLEIRLGYLHRGIEKRMTEVPWQQGRFVAEAAASDTAAGNALAHAIAIESLTELAVPPRAQYLRTLALEIERLAMHIADVGGMAVDMGFLAVASSLSRLRGSALGLADLLSGSRFLRCFIAPGGVKHLADDKLSELRTTARALKMNLDPFLDDLINNAVVYDRTNNVGKVSSSLAREFGLVGVAGRASGIPYDARVHFDHGVFPKLAPAVAIEQQGDVLARVKVRVSEIRTSLDLIDKLLDDLPEGSTRIDVPPRLPAETFGVGIVESFRGELIHLVLTDQDGLVKRYHIKDPSVNNWTGLAIAVRNNLVADFPICNKSFSLSYSGHDL